MDAWTVSTRISVSHATRLQTILRIMEDALFVKLMDAWTVSTQISVSHATRLQTTLKLKENAYFVVLKGV